MEFKVRTHKKGPLRIDKLLEQHANSLWIPDHLSKKQTAQFALDHFKKQIATELQMLQIFMRK